MPAIQQAGLPFLRRLALGCELGVSVLATNTKGVSSGQDLCRPLPLRPYCLCQFQPDFCHFLGEAIPVDRREENGRNLPKAHKRVPRHAQHLRHRTAGLRRLLTLVFVAWTASGPAVGAIVVVVPVTGLSNKSDTASSCCALSDGPFPNTGGA